jgi:hypothetical protein
MSRYAKDLAERVLSTYVQVYLGLWIASGIGIEFVTDLSSADKALVATLPTALSVLKGLLAKTVSDPDSASLANVPAVVVSADPEVHL